MCVEINNRITELRKSHNYTQKEIADLIGLDESHYCCIENGLCNVTYEILKKLSCIYGIEIQDITYVLDNTLSSEQSNSSYEQIFQMLDLFYANKSLFTKNMIGFGTM